jgi:RNA polymerase sigma factor (TIGR02999 family)
MPEPDPIADALRRARSGDPHALDALVPWVYQELRSLAAKYLRGERPGHTLQPTALTHEAYMRLVRSPLTPSDRGHFLAIGARVMRQILVEHARTGRREKRGGGWARVTLQDDLASGGELSLDVLALDEALGRLGSLHPRKARVVELLWFGGLSAREAAEVIEIAPRTVERDWEYARAWLLRELSRGTGGDGDGGPKP